MNRPLPLEGKVTMVTGGNTGIGRKIVEHFASSGSDVVIGHFQPDGVDEIAAKVKEFGRKVVTTEVDIRKPDQVQAMVDRTRETFGDVNYFICNAAAQHCLPILEMTDDQINQIVDTNLKGTIFCIRSAAKLMLQKPEADHRFVLISSINADIPQKGLSVYGATKGGLESLTRALSVELGEHGINVNAIQPGPTATDRTLQIPGYRNWGTVTPTGRVSEESDVAELAVFLCSPGSKQINGETIRVNGGLTNVRPKPTSVRPG
jgi:NAD(P)-dependent dehydrogenase (short-subunit alcohol dehydrogenase family)